MFDGLSLDPIALLVDGRSPAEVGVGRRHVVWALMVTLLVVVLDEGFDQTFELFDDLRDQGEQVSKNRVARLADLAGIAAQIGYKRRPGGFGGKPRRPREQHPGPAV